MVSGPISFHIFKQHQDLPLSDPQFQSYIEQQKDPARAREIRWLPETSQEAFILAYFSVVIILLGFFPHDAFFEFFKIC